MSIATETVRSEFTYPGTWHYDLEFEIDMVSRVQQPNAESDVPDVSVSFGNIRFHKSPGVTPQHPRYRMLLKKLRERMQTKHVYDEAWDSYTRELAVIECPW